MSWAPPPNGSPCWLQMYAKDLERAKQFYSAVFKWNFRESRHSGQRPGYGPTEMAHFETPNNTNGGIFKIDPSEHVSTKGKGGITLYIYVESLAESMDKIVAAGGTKMSEPEGESDQGAFQLFEDTEGNHVGLYTWKSSGPQSEN